MRPATLLPGILLAGFISATVFGLTAVAGDTVRKAAVLSLDETPPEHTVSLTDAPSGSGDFFERRDSVDVVVPWDMTLGALLALYHLDNNASARNAIESRLGASEARDELAKGQAFRFVLTAREDVR